MEVYENAGSLMKNSRVLVEIAVTYYLLDEQSKIKQIQQELLSRSEEEYISPAHLGVISWLANDREMATGFIKQAITEKDSFMAISSFPTFEGLPELQSFLKQEMEVQNE